MGDLRIARVTFFVSQLSLPLTKVSAGRVSHQVMFHLLLSRELFDSQVDAFFDTGREEARQVS